MQPFIKPMKTTPFEYSPGWQPLAHVYLMTKKTHCWHQEGNVNTYMNMTHKRNRPQMDQFYRKVDSKPSTGLTANGKIPPAQNSSSPQKLYQWATYFSVLGAIRDDQICQTIYKLLVTGCNI